MTAAKTTQLPADQLQLGDLTSPQHWPVAPGWRPLVGAFSKSPTGVGLLDFLQARVAAGAVIFPPHPLRALQLTPPDAVRAVIIGQDPYHGRGQAEGLAFSVAPGVRVPPSLRNIFQEIERDVGRPPPPFPSPGGSLVDWATQHGVLLLNSCLTVEEGQPASHAGQGWEVLTDAVIGQVATGLHPVSFLLWGAQAQAKRSLIDEARHQVLIANHPSPLSARRGLIPFIGCGHFSKARLFEPG